METAIQISNLGKSYRIGLSKKDNLRESIGHLFKTGRRSGGLEEFWALRDVDLLVHTGEVVGIIGRNGAGKSTLLKILSRITHPSTGEVELHGRISSLLEVGTGFHPELTGRENVYLNGTILGMSRGEIKKKFDQIIEFSGVDKFIDTPVKHYSSGMKVRLAFSVAAHLEPEILLIDEVLAVGDAEFQKKCLGKMKDVAGGGRTVLFVSHNLGVVQSLCDRTAYLKDGRIEYFGSTPEAIERYISSQDTTADLLIIQNRKGTGTLRFRSVELLDSNNQPASTAFSGMSMAFRISYQSERPLRNVVVRLQVVSWDGYILFTCNNFHSSTEFPDIAAEGSFVCKIPKLPLNAGEYRLNLQCIENRTVLDELEHVAPFQVEPGRFYPGGKLPSVKQGVLVDHEWIIG